MIKTNLTQKFSALLVAALVFFTSSSVQAQTPIWGAEMGTGGTGYTYGTFSHGGFNNIPVGSALSDTSWNAVSIKMTDPTGATTVSGGNAFWERLGPPPADTSGGSYAGGGTASNSPGAATGLAIFDSDKLDNGGSTTSGTPGTGAAPSGQTYIGANNGASPPEGFHRGELISPKIDLLGQVGNGLVIKFWHLYTPLNVTSFSVGLSIDNGVTWTDQEISIPTGSNHTVTGGTFLEFSFSDLVTPDPFLPLTDCRIRFSFEGSYYFYMIDEVSITSQPLVNLAFAAPISGGNILQQATAMQVSNSRYTPSNQVDMSQFLYGSRISNSGSQNVLNRDVSISIEKLDSVGSSCVIYQDTIIADTIFANDPGTVTPSDTFTAANFVNGFTAATLSDGQAGYRATYTINGSGVSPTNGTVTRDFSITDNYWSRAQLTVGGFPYASTPVLIATTPGNNLNNFIWGSVFYAASDDVLDSVALQYYVANAYVGSGSQGLKINVYEWNDVTTVDSRIDDEATLSNAELNLVGDGLINLTGISGGQTYQDTIVAVREFPLGVNPLVLTAGKRYLVAYAQGKDFGGVAFTGNTGIYFAGDETLDYSYNMLADAANGWNNPAATTITFYPNNVWPGVLYSDEQGASSGNGWGNNGFGGDLVPSLGLVMSPKTVNASLCSPPVMTSVTEVEETVAGELMVYPNPTSTAINVEVNFEKEVANISYRLTDVMGKVISTANSANVLSEVKTFDLQSAPAGVYFISIQSDNNIMTKRFIKK